MMPPTLAALTEPPYRIRIAARDLGAVELGDPATDRRADLLGVLGRSDLAGTDRPYRLIGDHELGDLLRREAGERTLELGQACS